MDTKILKITGLEKEFESKFKLNIDELYLERNKILSIIGPNGSGKSTLLKLIGLLEKPDKGSIIFNGENISNGRVDRIRIRKEMIIVFQEPAFFNTSVYNNILIGLKIRKIKVSEIRDKIDYFIQKLKIEKLLDRNVNNLSGGERQRVSLVRSLVLDPQLLLMDEPLANIDQQSREDLREDLFEILKNSGKSIIYVTHERNEALILSDDIAVLNEGRIEQFGKKEEIFKKPVNEFTAKFVGVETLIPGVVNKCKENICNVKIGSNGGRAFVSAKALPGSKVELAIRPEAVILYSINLKPQESSAMNLFTGRITEIKDIGISKKVVIDCGFDLISFVTQNSVDRLGLAIGKKIYAGVKASSIHMFNN